MGATYKLKRKKADGTLEDVALAGGLPFVNNITAIAGSTNNPTKWYVANVGGVTTPTDGMTIAVRTPNGGHSYGIALSINGGNNYYPVIRNKDTQISTQYPQGVTLILTFNSTQEVGSYLTGAYAKITGCWQIADYSDDRYVSQTYTTTNDVYPLLFRSNAGRTSTSNILSQTRYANNLYVNPSTGTVYANDFVVGGKSIVGGGSSGIRKITADGELNLTSSTVGAYFKIAGSVAGATEFYVGEEAIVLDSNYDYFISVEGILKIHASANSQAWKVMVIIRKVSGSSLVSYYAFHISTTATSGVYIGDDVGGGSYSGILCE